MSSHFPYQDPDQAAKFALGYFERLRADPDIRKTWQRQTSNVKCQTSNIKRERYVICPLSKRCLA